ncbi:MAG TPA: hypothetical protein VK826_18960 [Bacteroidia bacterium]|nr:hypothetical protein [Bacteroidia bacterium]
MMDPLNVLKSLLGEFFKYNLYADAIVLLRRAVKDNPYYQHNWENVKQLIADRDLEPRLPLQLMDVSANLPLDENSDEEAYRWLQLMVKNVENENNEIVVY